MKIAYQLSLIAALGLVAATRAQAQVTGEMLLGFNDAAGPSTAQNDYVVDLGSIALYTTTAQLTQSFSGTTFNTAFSTDANALNNVAAGLVGGYEPATGLYMLDQTAPGGGPIPNSKARTASWLSSTTEGQGATLGEYSSAGPNNGSYGWSGIVAISPTIQGTAPGGTVAGNTGNPMANLSSGIVTETLYGSTGTGLRNFTPSAWSVLGTFVVNANTDTVTYTGAAVPEPSTYGVLAGFGLLLVALRRSTAAKLS